ncbi:peptidase S8 [Nostoc linckia z18]|uniref:Peptidase S8 n=2 Tax=Nostoc linckia TaxID=92942 RepID=A0A9Q6EL32_NOSLI|nr:S8 family serine peptidase [Nostoc linckia]PHK41210.1 peptidase S8 [Nostoc linckia z15]PHK45174.1 peptidase S8 [Nostoc linckia z16]PHJ62415.1 peptidase S8 [Nostoc linckia z1]PHJ62489.1 peptidase S8 [Nostoc linckia z3]PHJ71248.1 peptidase S8 [Nostoc linckia z2]
MVEVRYGGQNGQRYELAISDEHIVVRTENRSSLVAQRPFEVVPVSIAARSILNQFELTTRFRQAGVEVLRAKVPLQGTALRDRARSILNDEPKVEFAGRVLVDPRSQEPVIYTENLFVKFDNRQDSGVCEEVLGRYNLTIKRKLGYARNAYFVSAPVNTGLAIFDISQTLLNEPLVELCHPELVRELRPRQIFPQQWHLKQTTINGKVINAHANVEAAWKLSDGTGATIAIIDDGVDLDHEEFRSSGKIVAPRDVTRKTNDPRPGNEDHHGTACAGVACANGNFGASGVAPGAKLMPIRLASALGSQNEADAFVWAAQNGADVISCSWGPADGVWFEAKDPLHNQKVPLPDSTRLAIDFAINNGRNGKGCVVLFAAGNGNESVDNDGYASYQNVIAVAACNDYGTRSAYSDFGKAIWCAFPSNHGDTSQTPGIWTTDRSGKVGYNSGKVGLGDNVGNYTNEFGGTSSACPGAAGVAALIIGRNPNLRWDEVRDIIKRSCDRIDQAGGKYDANGRSPFYGYGRINALKAVELAKPNQPSPIGIFQAVQDVPINDLQTSKLQLAIANTNLVKSIKVSVDIEHTYIADLIVTLNPPAQTGVSPIILHDRLGGSSDNIKTTYDEVNTPKLAAFKGKNPQGNWTLEVQDKANLDTGKIRSFTIEIAF